MNFCCQRQQSTLTELSGHDSQNFMKNTTTTKLKYSFRTQQATSLSNKQPNTNINTVTQSQLYHTTYHPVESKLLSIAASQNDLIELERQRQSLIIQDRQLDDFYHQRIVPLEKEVQFYQHQVKVRSIEIMELEGLLGKRVQERIDIEGKRNSSEQYHPQMENVLTSQVNNSQPIIHTIRPSQPQLLSPQSPRQLHPPQHIILAPQPVIITSPLSPRQPIAVSQFIIRPQLQPVRI